MKWNILILFATLSIPFAPRLAGADGDYAGYVIRVQGTGNISNTVSHRTARLTPANAPFFRIFAHHRICCERGSVLYLQLRYGGETNITSTQWIPVPLEADPLSEDNERKRAAESVTRGLTTSGRPRGQSVPIIFQPAGSSRVRRDQPLLMRWTPVTNATELSVEIAYAPSALIWSTNYPATAGQGYATEFLELVMSSGVPEEAEFVVHCGLRGQPSRRFTFSFLESAAEKKLETRLTEAAKAFREKGAAYHLMRAGILDDFKLYNEAADAYDLALKCANESIELLKLAKQAHENIGDVSEANRLAGLLGQEQPTR